MQTSNLEKLTKSWKTFQNDTHNMNLVAYVKFNYNGYQKRMVTMGIEPLSLTEFLQERV